MKFTLSWLKEHLETDADLATLLDRLTMIGLEVEKVTDRAEGLEGFVVGHVLDAAQHPDADRLRVCRVDIGGEEFQVVCGAPNARTGMKGVFAREGSYVPGTDLKLKKTKIRGVESSGMLLSEREMGLSDEHDGIVDLPEDAPIGAPATQVMGLDDPIIEIAITPNRGDCLGVRGIARDLAAAGVGTLKPLDAAPVTGAFKSPIEVHLDFPEDKQDACPYFIGRMIRGVTNGPSPAWLQDKLLAIGLRPISALVDITNLVTFDLGRPLHVFDAAHVSGPIRPRLAKPGETLAALDGKTYELDAEMCVIADDDKAEGLGGVMGGEASGCTETTTDVYVECAYFDPVRTAMTGRKLNLMSDARYRFERGVDPAFLIDGMEIATRLIQELCGGEASETVIAGEEPAWRRQLTLGAERVRTLGGIDVDAEETERILTVLGFGVSRGADGFTVEVPSWRPDIVGEACLVEEVVRIHGYDRIPTVSMEKTEPLPGRALSTEQSRRSIARRTLAQRGMTEAVTYSFLADKDAALFGEIADSVRLGNPISSDLDVMRPSLLPNLINAASRNAARGIASSQIFEVGDPEGLVGGDRRTRHLSQDLGAEPVQPGAVGGAGPGVVVVAPEHAPGGVVIAEVEGAVLADHAVDGPLPGDQVAPAGRPAGHRDDALAGGPEPFHGGVGVGGEPALRGQGVVDVAEHRVHGQAGGVGKLTERHQGGHRGARPAQPRSSAPVALATPATILSATASISASVRVLSMGCRVAVRASDFLPAPRLSPVNRSNTSTSVINALSAFRAAATTACAVTSSATTKAKSRDTFW